MLDEERKRFEAERAAFESFRGRVTEMETTQSDTLGLVGRTISTAIGESVGATGLDAVRAAYRETVMSIAHYEEDYDESLAENLTGEFGSEVAAAVVKAERLTPPLHETLLTHAQQASERRTAGIEVLETESAGLENALETLGEIQQELATLRDRSQSEWSGTEFSTRNEVVLGLEEQCETLAAVRQCEVTKRRGEGRRFEEEFETYLYDSLPVDHPVLADVAVVGERLRAERDRIGRALLHH